MKGLRLQAQGFRRAGRLNPPLQERGLQQIPTGRGSFSRPAVQNDAN